MCQLIYKKKKNTHKNKNKKKIKKKKHGEFGILAGWHFGGLLTGIVK